MPTSEAEAFHAALTGATAPAPTPTPPPAPQEPAAAAPDAGQPAKKSLEDLLSGLDEETRKVVLGEVSTARNEAKNLRTRLKDAEPKVAEYDRLAQASQTDAERAQAALAQAETRTRAANERVARAEVKAALAGLDNAPDVDDLNLARFLTEDGDVNQGAIDALTQKYAAASGRRAPRPDRSQASGANGPAPAGPASEFASILQSAMRGGG